MQPSAGGEFTFGIDGQPFLAPDRLQPVIHDDVAEHFPQQPGKAAGHIQLDDVGIFVGEDQFQPVLGMATELIRVGRGGGKKYIVIGKGGGFPEHLVRNIGDDDGGTDSRFVAEERGDGGINFFTGQGGLLGDLFLVLMKKNPEVRGGDDAPVETGVEGGGQSRR